MNNCYPTYCPRCHVSFVSTKYFSEMYYSGFILTCKTCMPPDKKYNGYSWIEFYSHSFVLRTNIFYIKCYDNRIVIRYRYCSSVLLTYNIDSCPLFLLNFSNDKLNEFVNQLLIFS